MVLGVVAKVANHVGAADRVGLAEQVVGERDVAIRVGVAELGQRRAGARADLGLVGVEQDGEVGVGAPALEDQLQGRVLFGGECHRRDQPTDWSISEA